MSRIGKKPINIPQGVKVEQQGRSIEVSGPLGTLKINCDPKITVKVSNGNVVVENNHPENRQAKQMHGTTRAILANMVSGVSSGFEKKMEIYGTGYNVKEQGGKLIFQIGFAQDIQRTIPKGVKVHIEVAATRGGETPAKFTLSGVDKALLGQFASDIRKIRRPEPYKGKGIRFAGEHIKHKVGKAFTTGTT